MTTTQTTRPLTPLRRSGPTLWTPRRLRLAVVGIGGLYLFTAGVNLGVTVARPAVYATWLWAVPVLILVIPLTVAAWNTPGTGRAERTDERA